MNEESDISVTASMSAVFTAIGTAASSRKIPILIDLPDDIAKGVGNVVAAFSYHEYVLHLIVNKLMDIGIKDGRIAAGQPRGKDAIISCPAQSRNNLLTLHT